MPTALYRTSTVLAWDSPRNSRWKFILKHIKIFLLLVLWCFFTVVLIGAPIDEMKTKVVTVLPKQTTFRDLEVTEDAIQVAMIGPIVAILEKFPSNAENVPSVGIRILWLDAVFNETIRRTDMWNVYLEKKQLGHFDKVSKLFYKPISGDVNAKVSLESKCEYPVALIMQTDSSPMTTKFGTVYAGLLILGLLLLIYLDITDPTFAILLMATTGLATVAALGHRPGLPMITTWVDLRIVILMLSMMIISGITSESGIFNWLAIQIFRFSRGHRWLLLFSLVTVTTTLSSIIPNVMIVFLMCPVAVLLCEVIPIQTHLVIFVVIVYSNIGGALTLVGESFNMIIATKTKMEFIYFTVHMFPGVLGGALVGFLVIYLTMRRKLSKLTDRQIAVMAKRRSEMPHLEEEIGKLEDWLRKSHSLRPCIKPANLYFNTLAYLKAHYGIRDKMLMAKSLIVLIFVQISFVFHTQIFVPGASLYFLSLLGAILLIILTKLEAMDAVLHYLDWSVVVFMGAHFVFIQVLHVLGLVPWLGSQAVKVISNVETRYQPTVAILMVIWMTAFLTALVNNIAVVEMSIVLIKDLSLHTGIKVQMPPLLWALSYGAAFGANGSLLGAHANLMGVVVARRFGYRITYLQFFLYGFPVMLASLAVASAYLLIAYSHDKSF